MSDKFSKGTKKNDESVLILCLNIFNFSMCLFKQIVNNSKTILRYDNYVKQFLTYIDTAINDFSQKTF